MTEIPALYAQRPIVPRHALYHPFMEAAALTLVDIPITLVISGAFGVILYFMVGLQQSTGEFFCYKSSCWHICPCVLALHWISNP